MTAIRAGTGPPGPAGPAGADGARGAQGPIGGLVLTTPPAMAFGREIGTANGSGGSATLNLVTTADVNAGETVVLAVGWDTVSGTTAITSVIDAAGKGSWIVDATNHNTNGPSDTALVVGQFSTAMLSGSTIVITWAGAVSDKEASATAMVGIFSPGASTQASKDTSVNSSNTGTLNLTTGTVTTTGSSELVFALWRVRRTGGSTITATVLAGWTLIGASPKIDASGGSATILAYKICTPGAQSPTATLGTGAASTFTTVIARYAAGVAWTVIPSVTSEKLWVTDPTYGALGDGVTNDATAINAAIAAGVAAIGGGGIVAFPPSKTYMIGSPLEVLGRVKIQGFEARNTFIKATAGFTKSQMIRNWTAADWNSGTGEVDGRTFPASTVHAGTHTAALYPQISGLHLHANSIHNLSMIAWAGPQETSYFQDLILETGIAVDGNDGVWGFDLQSTTNQGFNNGRIQDITLYGEGWERQISMDGISTGGSDMQIRNVTFSPAQIYHSQVFIQRVFGVHFHNCHWEAETNTAAQATFALVSAYGFAMSDCSCTVKTVNNKPFILHTRRSGGPSIETPADLKGINFNYQGGTPTSDWPGGFITDLWNTVNAYGTVTVNGASLTAANPPRMLHRYNGAEMVWTDNAEGLHKLP